MQVFKYNGVIKRIITRVKFGVQIHSILNKSFDHNPTRQTETDVHDNPTRKFYFFNSSGTTSPDNLIL